MTSPVYNLAEPDRVRRATAPDLLRQLDTTTADHIRDFGTASPEAIERRIAALEREPSIERILQLNVATAGLATAVLAFSRQRLWGLLTCAGLAAFLVHAAVGFAPPLSPLRRRGFRSRAEINREIYALKALRGDFRPVDESPALERKIAAALAAVGL